MSATWRTLRRSLAVTAATVVAAGSLQPATAQVPGLDTIAQVAQIPGVTSLPDIPGLGGTAGGNDSLDSIPKSIGAVTDAAGQIVPGAGGLTPDDPNAGQSTKPECAPLMLVAVPATGGISPDWDPNRPVGLMNSLVGPLRAELGDKLSETYINYPADLAVKGTAYSKSVQMGAEKKPSPPWKMRKTAAPTRKSSSPGFLRAQKSQAM